MLKFITYRRFSYVDGAVTAAATIAFYDDRWLPGVLILVVGTVMSLLLETIAAGRK